MTVELNAVDKRKEVDENQAAIQQNEPIVEESKTQESTSQGQVTLEPGQAFNQDTVLLKWVQA